MKNNRVVYFDFAKGILILLVLFGHAIQYGSGNQFLTEEYYWDNVLMKAIYSFHMPLFIMISGFFTYGSLKKSGAASMVKKRITRLIKPIVSWVPIIVLLGYFINSIKITPKEALRVFLTDFWFLWAVLYCSILIAIGESLALKWKVIFYVIVQICFFIIPDILWLNAYKFVFPFFLMGYYFAARDTLNKMSNFRVGAIAMTIWFVLLLFYTKDTYIYTTGYTLLRNSDEFLWYRQLGINIYRMLVGLVGSIAWLSVLKLIWSKLENRGGFPKWTVWLGKHSIAIYILSTYSFTYLLPLLCNKMQPNLFLWIIETILMAAVCSGLTYLINKCKLLSKYLIGE